VNRRSDRALERRLDEVAVRVERGADPRQTGGIAADDDPLGTLAFCADGVFERAIELAG
jgi:hypothetical protein